MTLCLGGVASIHSSFNLQGFLPVLVIPHQCTRGADTRERLQTLARQRLVSVAMGARCSPIHASAVPAIRNKPLGHQPLYVWGVEPPQRLLSRRMWSGFAFPGDETELGKGLLAKCPAIATALNCAEKDSDRLAQPMTQG